MDDQFKNLRKIMARRDALHAVFAEQHRTAHDDRHVTAGKIYENTKDLEAACRDLLDGGEEEGSLL